jgi:hypothetical protein
VDRLRPSSRSQELAILLLLSIGAFLIHGYHPGVEDAEIYLPGIEKMLHPGLFPLNTQFFASHAQLTLFPNLIAVSARITHLPLDGILLVFEFGSIFLLLLACWKLSCECFDSSRARWCGVALVASLLTLPVAGTALYILDQYTNPRNLAAFAAIFAVAGTLRKKYAATCLWLAFATLMHPLMSVFALSFCGLLVWMRNPSPGIVAALPFGILFTRPSAAYQQAAPGYFYILNWQWYEWIGIVAPIALLWWFRSLGRSKKLGNLELICSSLIIYDLVYFAGALIFTIPARFESVARLQPLRSLHLLYILLFLIVGGMLGEYVLQNRMSRWAALFLPLCLGMFVAQHALFPASPHIEWSLSNQQNDWSRAFVWIRRNTPPDAFFALDPLLMRIPGEDTHGFRAIAQRSMLADATKDAGAVSMFPELAYDWQTQVESARGWKHFQLQDFKRLQYQYGVGWIVLQQPGVPGLSCPYSNKEVVVCQLD